MMNAKPDVDSALASIVRRRPDAWGLSACGVTRTERPIAALVHRDAYAASTDRARVLLVGGLSGAPDDVALALRSLEHLAESDAVALSAVPCANPDGLAQGVAPGNGSGGNPAQGYPPRDGFFFDPENPEARYLWRWTCFQAPDLVLEMRSGPTATWEANAAASRLSQALDAAEASPHDSLIAALGVGTPDGLGPIPGLRLTAPEAELETQLQRLLTALSSSALGTSPARQELDRRRFRSPLEIARVLASTYGHKLDPVVYTQGVAISGRLRLARLDPDGSDPSPDIAAMLEHYASGQQDPWGDSPATSNLAGVIWGDELAEAIGDRRFSDLLLQAAARYQRTSPETPPPPSDPDFRTEDMFMNGAIFGRAFNLTGDHAYLDMLTPFILNGGIQQDDGLFYHCRSAPYYWGRGNGFALMGLTETLTYLPQDHPDRDAILTMYRRQVQGLSKLQQPSGMFLQVLDFPGSYQEHTATCMIGYSLARGIRRGWLDTPHRDMLDRAWQAIAERVDDQGDVVDGCTGTGVQASLRDYLDRPAIFGYDDRTGSMAIWFACEMESLRRGD